MTQLDSVAEVVEQHAIGLGVRRLLAMSPLPMDWAEQRKALGL